MARISPALRPWLPVIALSAIVWSLGGDSFSQPETSRILGPLIDWLLPGWPAEQKAELLFLIRKLAHPAEYGLLALLSFRAVSLTSSAPSTLTLAGLALLPVAVLASADEARQAFSADRTGSAWDVALDVVGGVIVLAVVIGLQRGLGRPLFAPRARASR